MPKIGDQVVGIIEERNADFYRVNIFSGAPAMLSRLGFEGATKRNKPDLKVGDVIYCRVSLAHRDLDVELTCLSSSGNKKGWSSGESVSPCSLPLTLTPIICII
jgi:exosome complex component RRP40